MGEMADYLLDNADIPDDDGCTPCTDCGGSGDTPFGPCGRCDGTGYDPEG